MDTEDLEECPWPNCPMKTDLSDEEVKLIVEALEHYYAYTRATQRDDSRYQELADRLRKKR